MSRQIFNGALERKRTSTFSERRPACDVGRLDPKRGCEILRAKSNVDSTSSIGSKIFIQIWNDLPDPLNPVQRLVDLGAVLVSEQTLRDVFAADLGRFCPCSDAFLIMCFRIEEPLFVDRNLLS